MKVTTLMPLILGIGSQYGIGGRQENGVANLLDIMRSALNDALAA
jgi:hypothetical protein